MCSRQVWVNEVLKLRKRRRSAFLDVLVSGWHKGFLFATSSLLSNVSKFDLVVAGRNHKSINSDG